GSILKANGFFLCVLRVLCGGELLCKFFAVAVIGVFVTTAAHTQSVSIQLQDNTFKVIGWQPGVAPAGGWASVFKVYAGSGDIPAMVGSYGIENGALTFHPRYPLADGVKYRATFQQPGQSRIV